jgi:NCAIR mutase (PurE)-related protein
MGHRHSKHIGILEGFAKLDLQRTERTGIPEAILAEGKTTDQVVEALRRMTAEAGLALATRVDDVCATTIKRALGSKFRIHHVPIARTVVVSKKGVSPKLTGGVIAILAAGTSDIPTAEEARVTAEMMGCEVLAHYDLEPLDAVLSKGVSAIVVVAGMEGALPSVVRGLVAVPVIGVPTSTGYGYGGHGQAALMTMLQSCAPGLTVVNIDNGFGAGATAALIANQVALARTAKH